MARRRGKKSRRGGSKKMPLAVVAPMAIVAYEAGHYAVKGDMDNAKYVLTGVRRDGTWSSGRTMQTYTPVLVGVVIHKAASRLGVNRYIPKWLPVSI